MKKVLIVCTTDSMIFNFLIPHIQKLKDMNFEVECACSETGYYFDELSDKYNIVMHKIPFERSPYKIRNFTVFKSLCRLVSSGGYNTIFCHEPIGGIMGRAVGHKYGCKVVYMAHGFHFFKGAPKTNWIIYYTAEKLFSRFTDVLITINKEDYNASLDMKAKENIKINGIGIDTKKFILNRNPDYLRKELNLTENDIIVLSVGELIERKNHLTVIKAIKMLENRKVHYVIAGEGELLQKLQEETQKMDLSAQIHFLGYRKDINKICNSADIFIMPSVHEGLSVALMEAMACGLPVIASEIRGNTDLIDNEKGGLLVETFGADGYAEAIERMLNDSRLLSEYGNYNINRVKDFDIDFVMNQCEKIYKNF